MSKEVNRTTLTLKVKKQTRAQLEKLAEKRGLTLSTTAREILEKNIAKEMKAA